MAEGGVDACFIAIGTHEGNHLDIPAADTKTAAWRGITRSYTAIAAKLEELSYFL